MNKDSNSLINDAITTAWAELLSPDSEDEQVTLDVMKQILEEATETQFKNLGERRARMQKFINDVVE